LPVILYGFETWSLALREGTQSEILWKSGAEENIWTLEEVTGGWRKLHNELHNLHGPTKIIRVIKLRKMREVGHVARMGDEKCI